MAGNETIIVDDGELLELINETTSLANDVFYITATEEFEKKKNNIFAELDKDLLNWEKHIEEYRNNVLVFYKLEEGVKEKLLKQLEMPKLEKDVESFNNTLKKLQMLLDQYFKKDCTDLISVKDSERLLKFKDNVNHMKDILEGLKEVKEFEENHSNAKTNKNTMHRVAKMLKNLDSIEEGLNIVQKRAIQNVLQKLRT